MAKRIGIIPHAYARPLFEGLLRPRKAATTLFEIVTDDTAQLAQKLRQQELDGAFLSPIDYAKDYSRYSLVPDVAASSGGASGTVVLLFKERLHTIQTLAVDAKSSSEIVLAHLVLAEKYDAAPQIVPVAGSPDVMLAKADAALLIGDAALDFRDRLNKIDLVDEWNDITGLQYVHGVWAAPKDSLTVSEIQELLTSAREGEEELGNFADPGNTDYLNNFSYEFDEDTISAFTEFLKMAYYHGILKDIPDIKFHSKEEIPSVSSNPVHRS